MGVNISEIVPKQEITIADLRGKTIAIDAFNTLYQFLTSIRQQDGTPLQDKDGNITSHLSGLFYRNINLLQEGITSVYVFDGKIPELKQQELARRRERKGMATQKFEAAKKDGDKSAMRKFAMQTVSMTNDIINESKELLTAMGIQVIEAPGEGEAEASYLARNHKVWAAASQDYDALLYGAPQLVRNLTLARRRKSTSGIYVDVTLELVTLEQVLTTLNITLEQLICCAILVGTDYNPGGVKGLGQKKALEFVQRYKTPTEIFKAVADHDSYTLDFDWNEVFAAFNAYKSEKVHIKAPPFNPERVRELLLARDFSLDRINNGLDKIQACREQQQQKGLTEYW